MIWGAYGESRQSFEAKQAKSEARSAGRTADRLEAELSRQQKHLDRLSLACQAMWELLRDYSSLSEEHLEAKMREVDLRDGSEDGRMSRQLLDCPHCGRPTNSRRELCLMCGGPLDRAHAFEGE